MLIWRIWIWLPSWSRTSWPLQSPARDHTSLRRFTNVLWDWRMATISRSTGGRSESLSTKCYGEELRTSLVLITVQNRYSDLTGYLLPDYDNSPRVRCSLSVDVALRSRLVPSSVTQSGSRETITIAGGNPETLLHIQNRLPMRIFHVSFSFLTKKETFMKSCEQINCSIFCFPLI